ncbi:MAG: hypothetical protein SOR11_07510 [Fusobacterium sp.]|uniref:hypothetical protein n=1 Tax=Fusobacterium sp. TaxID=68766 RepID=UPI002A74E281|nr:hypothetical protein [Fusobacterium sp.]MDY3059829.1 hypothetical protein [Fusobacterium sp.]
MEFTKSEMIAFLAVIIQPVSIGISFYLGNRANKLERKKQILLERYDNFYLPYLRLLTQRLFNLPESINLLEKLSSEALEPFEELIANNLKYIDKSTLEWYPVFVQVNLDFLEYEAGSKGFEKIPKYRKAIFILLTSKILQKTIEIADDLGLPDPTVAFPNEYKDSSHIDKYLIMSGAYSAYRGL